MDVFKLRDRLIKSYAEYAKSFIHIRDGRIDEYVDQKLREGAFWPEPLIQLNPMFEPGAWIDDLVGSELLHQECSRIFRRDKAASRQGQPLRLYRHQLDAIQLAHEGHNYVLTTGTGSGKSLAYIIPIVDHVVRRGSGRGIQAIIVYPMNALANSQYGELEKFLCRGYPEGQQPVTFERYTGQESEEKRNQIIANPPDILLTNYVMLELLLTRPREERLIQAAEGLRFLVLDELHTYRGRQGADVALLVRRVRDRMAAKDFLCIGTSATLASEGSYDAQREEVAHVATQLFGAVVRPEHVIGETLQRATREVDETDSSFIEALTARLRQQPIRPPQRYREFVTDPFSVWVESTFGVRRDPESRRLVRCMPISIYGEQGAARKLSACTGIDENICGEAIERWLLAGYACEPHPETGSPPFAFRLHQFISPGDTVYASLEPEIERYITIHGQHYVPGSNRERLLLPLVFCRECGQEYYSVRMLLDDEARPYAFRSREFSDRFSDDEGVAGYLYLSTDSPWPADPDEMLERVPDDWLETHKGKLRIRRNRRHYLPEPVSVRPDGAVDPDGEYCVFMATPFRFCPRCGVSYSPYQRSDYGKLASLSTEGRSSATTILSLSTLLELRESDLPKRARKLLSFTDNRQDASLQAGHFNDFVEVGLLRAALYQAVANAGQYGLRHDVLTQHVFDALNLPLEMYAAEPNVRFQALEDTKLALRDVIGYRLYRDLRRGWRVILPNLEQCGLLVIDYLSLDELCMAEDVWANHHRALAAASPETRARIARVLLDYMRRELAIKVNYLDGLAQERIQQRSNQRLIEPWAIDEDEQMERASILFPRPASGNDYGGNVYVSARGGFGLYLKRRTTFPDYAGQDLTVEDREAIIRDLLAALRVAGLVEVVKEDNDDVPGYQLNAGAMRWMAGDGTRPFHDPIRVPHASEEGGRPNPFFVNYYKTVATMLQGLEAREHTAQVPYEERVKREEQFRTGKLPLLYCSPTMELGVDIAELNIVNMRNVPPTPANYAQRSGRAGRSGQPALVFTYCSTGSPHDQYFFKRPEHMVTGAVVPPRLDLANEDLIRSHIHAIWLAETGIDLGKTLKDILDLSSESPSLALLPHIQADIDADAPRRRARERAGNVLAMLGDELTKARWYGARWLDQTINSVGQAFDRTCDRWRGLYRAALTQAEIQGKIIRDASRGAGDKRQAERLRREAEAQLRLLTEAESIAQSDFYSYRYFASEGFLPGYSFPRLPISAYIPGRRVRQRDEFLSRPRFLAISEFGPRAIIYHEGSRYIINQVILPVSEDSPLTTQVKLCTNCGYLHPVTDGEGPDLCECCGTALKITLRQLLRMQNVVTKRRDRINSDEEERLRFGYEIRTGIRFPVKDGHPTQRTAQVRNRNGEILARLTYAQAATLWRINLGWTRRKNKQQLGFVLDIERGYWARNDQMAEEDPDDPMSARTERVIPFVEDSRNCLIVEPSTTLDEAEMASLQAALKRAIEARYQLESNELAAEPLPDPRDRRTLLFFEAAEGGAGVLRHLLDEPGALANIAREALQICHFDPDTGEDLRRAPRSSEDCEAACYDCLLSYSNQREHAILDRHSVRDILLALADAVVETSPTSASREEHLAELMRAVDSDLERAWLEFLERNGYQLPGRAQVFFESCNTRPDFVYSDKYAVVYIDGPHHDYPERQQRDAELTACMEDEGYTVIRFGYRDEWDAVVDRHRHIFGSKA